MKSKLKVVLAGQKRFGADVLKLCLSLPQLEVVSVLCAREDKHICHIANENGVPISPQIEHDFDLGITAHYFGKISENDLQRAAIGWIGYHPSLLPRHRGKNSIRATIEAGDVITGGTVYWLSSQYDAGAIANQDFIFRETNDPLKLWTEYLAPLGITLLNRTLLDIASGAIRRQSQLEAHATYC